MNQKPSSPSLQKPVGLETSLDAAMRIDRYRLRRARMRLSPERYQRILNDSIQQRARRTAASPRIEYPTDLPISTHRDELVQLIGERQVVVVCGERARSCRNSAWKPGSVVKR